MSSFDVKSRTIFLAKHGSHAYGLATPTSDLDIKGVCIEPREYHLGFLHKFQQHERMAKKTGSDTDLVIYSLKKFSYLAANSNPNIIELLFGDDGDIISIDSFGEELRAFRRNFLSLKAKHTFAGYAYSQMKKMKTHRNWLLNPPKEKPNRNDYGLLSSFAVSRSEMGAYEALDRDGKSAELSKEAQIIFTRERAYKTAFTYWKQYQNWKKTRNPVRAALEAKHGYDTKHASHLIRLMRMCKEIMTLGEVIVKRPDREEILGIKNGSMTYEVIIEEAERLENECNVLYETSKILPKKPNFKKIDAFVVDLTQRYLSLHG